MEAMLYLIDNFLTSIGNR